MLKDVNVKGSSRGWFNTKIPSYQNRKSHCGDYDRLISTVGFPVLVRWHVNVELGSFRLTYKYHPHPHPPHPNPPPWSRIHVWQAQYSQRPTWDWGTVVSPAMAADLPRSHPHPHASSSSDSCPHANSSDSCPHANSSDSCPHASSSPVAGCCLRATHTAWYSPPSRIPEEARKDPLSGQGWIYIWNIIVHKPGLGKISRLYTPFISEVSIIGKKTDGLLLMHWRYCSLALNHQDILSSFPFDFPSSLSKFTEASASPVKSVYSMTMSRVLHGNV